MLFSNTTNHASFPIQSVLHQIEAVVKHPNKNTTTTKPQSCCGTPVELEGPGAKHTPPFWKLSFEWEKHFNHTITAPHTNSSLIHTQTHNMTTSSYAFYRYKMFLIMYMIFKA